MDKLLSKSELIKLTGTKHRSKQKAVLIQNGIDYIVRWDKSLTVTWKDVNDRKVTVSNDAAPDFDQIA